MRDINLLVVHCSATQAGLDVGAAEIRKWHVGQGWKDIGYHYVIRRSGAIEPGRPESEVGAHAQGYNAHSLGICLVGGVNKAGKGENNFTPAQFKALRGKLDELRSRYPKTLICGHRDLSPDANGDGIVEPNEWVKECPSFDVSSWCESVSISTEQ